MASHEYFSSPDEPAVSQAEIDARIAQIMAENGREVPADPITQAEVANRIDQYLGRTPAVASTPKPITAALPSSEIDIRIKGKGDGVTLIAQALNQLGASAQSQQASSALQVYPYYPLEPRSMIEQPRYSSYTDEPIPMLYDQLPEDSDQLSPYDETDELDEVDSTDNTPTNRKKMNSSDKQIDRPRFEHYISKKITVPIALLALAASGAGAWNAGHSGSEAAKVCGIDVTCYPGQYLSSFTFGLINPKGDAK